MCNTKSFALIVFFFCVGVLFILIFLLRPQLSDRSGDLQQKQKIVEREVNVPSPSIVSISQLDMQKPPGTQTHDRDARPDHALQSQNDIGIETAADPINDCPGCMDRIAVFLADPLQDEDAKISLLKTLMQSETAERTLLLVNTIMNAHLLEQSDFKDHLLQLLADVHTAESVKGLMIVINGEDPHLDFHQMPEDLQYAIQKAIRLNPDYRATGQMLADDYNSQASPQAAEDLKQIQHPMMISILAQEAYINGDTQKAEDFKSLLSTMSDPRTLEGWMLLSREDKVPLDEMNSVAYAWASIHGEDLYLDYYLAYLSDPNADAVQRSIAAFSVAASQNSEDALAALEKARDDEQDPQVRVYLQSAINMMPNQIDMLEDAK